MESNKISLIKEKRLAKMTDELTEQFIQSGFVQNPIDAKFLAFKETKKEIKTKDIL